MASTMIAGSSVLAQTQRSSLAGAALRQPGARPCLRPARQVVRAEADTKAKEKKDEKKPFSPPALDSSWPSPIFGGSTGGLMRKAQVLTSLADSCYRVVASLAASLAGLQRRSRARPWASPINALV